MISCPSQIFGNYDIFWGNCTSFPTRNPKFQFLKCQSVCYFSFKNFKILKSNPYVLFSARAKSVSQIRKCTPSLNDA